MTKQGWSRFVPIVLNRGRDVETWLWEPVNDAGDARVLQYWAEGLHLWKTYGVKGDERGRANLPIRLRDQQAELAEEHRFRNEEAEEVVALKLHEGDAVDGISLLELLTRIRADTTLRDLTRNEVSKALSNKGWASKSEWRQEALETEKGAEMTKVLSVLSVISSSVSPFSSMKTSVLTLLTELTLLFNV